MSHAAGPLAGLRVLEFEAIGPGPFAGDDARRHGRRRAARRPARRRRPRPRQRERRIDVMLRGRRSVTLDLKSASGAEAALRLAERADALIEGFRPGVMERLGLGPDALLARNPRLVYGRMTGWGQDGPARRRAPATTSTTSPSPACCTRSAAPARRRCRRSTWSATSAAAACCSPSASPAALIEARAQRPRPGRRRGDGRRRVAAGDDVLRHARRRHAGATRAAPTSSTPARPGTTPTRRATASTSRSARSSRSSTPSCSQRLGLDAESLAGRSTTAPAGRALRERFAARLRAADARRVVRASSKAPTPASRRCSSFAESRRASARRRARRHDRARRHRPAGAGAALRSHAGRGAVAAARARRAAAPRRLHDWGFDAAAIEALRGLGVGFAR